VQQAPLGEDHLVLGRYRPLRPLGSGGTGSVWLARDERSGRDVALKIVAREGNAGARAEREAAAAGRLRHPRCLRPLAVERDERHVYVAYDYVPGKTLREALRHGEVDDAGAIEAAAQLLEALAHAHAQGIVHRDVKPANAMLVEGDGVSVRLLDFGLAQVDEADTLTAAGDVPGTLAYVAPERLDGEAATGAADVWSVGVILWEALTARHPFWAASPLETARRISSGPPSLAVARPDLPRELAATVDEMLARDPRRRPQAKHLASRLRGATATAKRRRRPASSRRVVAERAIHAGLAVATAWLLPFYPPGWPLALGGIAALAALRSPLVGLAFALAVPVLPLGNVSLGLALAYVPLALAWLALFAPDARAGLLFAVGPVVAPLAALPLASVIALGARGPVRRAAQGAAAVGAAVAVAGLTRSPLPITAEAPPLGLGIAGSERPLAVAAAFASFLADHPALPLGAALLAAAAAAAPLALVRGPWALSAWGSVVVGATVLAPPLTGADGVSAAATVAGGWAATAALAALAVQRSRYTSN
jgi:Protein kinase domain